tara:strand:+ start:56 stop:1222 length:1167 start_codon:yes stop_codon:yes gene_type:complete
MNTFITSLDQEVSNQMVVTWDIGKRCNFDCVYCDPLTHDNTSPHASLETLSNTTDFIKEYLDIIFKYKTNNEDFSISLTGGEPTTNPNFPELTKYLKEKFGKRHVSVTSNGSFGKNAFDAIVDNLKNITVSYHCDAGPKIKEKVIQNILDLNEATKVRVNLMFHFKDEYFRECIRLTKFFEDNKIRYTPRVVNHKPYTKQQTNWFKDYWAEKAKAKLLIDKTKVHQIGRESIKVNKEKERLKTGNPTEEHKHIVKGRHCCASLPLLFENKETDTWEKGTYCTDTNFKNWFCSVNWFFLHIEQQTNKVFHHQTCQANWNNTRGPIGTLSESHLIIDRLKKQVSGDTVPVLQCTIDTCKCGMCTPKSQSIDTFNTIIKKHVKDLKFKNVS